MLNPVRTGIALAITVGIAYAACALVFWTWPEASAQFMNGLFHGLDFRKLRDGAGGFGFETFGVSLAGCVFGWLSNRLAIRG